jgi:hypothetical protein
VRDLILDQPVFWAKDLLPMDLPGGQYHHALWPPPALAQALDGATSLLGCHRHCPVCHRWEAKRMGAGFRPSRAPILLGIMPAIGGGLIRDVLAGRENRLMKRELDAIPVSGGCLTTAVLMTARHQVDNLIALACMGSIVLFRGSAIHWKLEVPDWLRMSTSQREPEATIHPQIPDRIDPHPSESIAHKFIPKDTGNHPRSRAILLRLRRRIRATMVRIHALDIVRQPRRQPCYPRPGSHQRSCRDAPTHPMSLERFSPSPTGPPASAETGSRHLCSRRRPLAG